MTGRDDGGFAMVTAVVAVGLFAWMALLFLQAGRGDAMLARAATDRARLEAAADAGVMIALHGLGQENRTLRWPIDGTARTLSFDGTALTVWIEDERGKVPINTASPQVLRQLLAGIGLQGEGLDALQDAILDWIDGDDAPRAHGAEDKSYLAAGAEMLPRNEAIRTLEELLEVRGMSPESFARLAPSLTLLEAGAFNERTATPLALMAMHQSSANSVEVQTRARDIAGAGRPAIEITQDISLKGRPLTLRVEARRPGGAALTRIVVVELTSDPDQPVWVRRYR
jgi:general secretion pathway protein K